MSVRTVSNAGGNYSSTSTWVEGAVPTSADDVVFTSTSGNLVINAVAAAKSVDMTNYIGTISGNNAWTVSGNLKLVSAVTFSGTWQLAVNATSTMTSNGKVMSQQFTFSGTNTYTLADNWTFTGIVSSSTATINRTSAGVGECTFKGTISSGTFSGTSKFTFDGCSITNPTIANVMEVNTTSGTFNITGSTFTVNGTSLSYIAGNTNCNTSTVRFYGACTLDCKGTNTTSASSSSGINFYNVTLGQASTNTCVLTLTSVLTSVGTFTTNNGNASAVSNSSTIYATGNITVNTAFGGGPGAALTGTSTLVVSGTGTWLTSGSVAASINLNMTINTSGTLTVSGNVYYSSGTLTYTAGTVVTTGSTLNLFPVSSSSCTLNTAGMTWNNVSNFSGSNTLTLNSTLTLNGNMVVCSVTNPGTTALTFAGSYGFSAGSIYSTAYAGTNIIFVAGVTYTASSIVIYPLTKLGLTNMVFKSSSAGTQATINISSPNNTIVLVDATDINSSGGRTIRTLRGTLSNATNWQTFTYTDHPVVTYTSCN